MALTSPSPAARENPRAVIRQPRRKDTRPFRLHIARHQQDILAFQAISPGQTALNHLKLQFPTVQAETVKEKRLKGIDLHASLSKHSLLKALFARPRILSESMPCQVQDQRASLKAATPLQMLAKKRQAIHLTQVMPLIHLRMLARGPPTRQAAADQSSMPAVAVCPTPRIVSLVLSPPPRLFHLFLAEQIK